MPRHPTSLCFDACTREAQLEEYDELAGDERDRARRSGRSDGATLVVVVPTTSWTGFIDREAATMLEHVLGNDPRPHYVHQANLAGDRMLLELADAVLDHHRELFTVTLTQPTLAEAGAELARRAAWQAAGRRVTAFLRDGKVHLSSTSPVQIPVTGVTPAGGGAAAESHWTACIGPDDEHVVLTPA